MIYQNVVGFENSECCNQFLESLHDVGYYYKQFILTPTQFGIPNSRPRYYCIASKVESLQMNKYIHNINMWGNQIQICDKMNFESKEMQSLDINSSDMKSHFNTILTDIPFKENDITITKSLSYYIDNILENNPIEMVS
jgi:site-specific DNA-cytosine methylase